MPSPSEMLNSVLGLIPHGLKWLYNLIFFAIVAYLVWRNREQVLGALRNFWAAIRSFWETCLAFAGPNRRRTKRSRPPPCRRVRLPIFRILHHG